jgi:AcrR family transcriptional regulator
MPTREPTKGALTRDRILQAAISLFAEDGFDAVSTREIAASAGVHQPVIAHYFGDKQGLYDACARAVIAGYLAHLSDTAAVARMALDDGACDPESAGRHLARLAGDISDFMATGRPEAAFITREMSHAGHAFDLFYKAVLNPGLSLLADLIELARPGNPDPAHARVEALMVLVSLSAFETGRPLLRRFLGSGPDLAAQERAAIVGSFIERLYG